MPGMETQRQTENIFIGIMNFFPIGILISIKSFLREGIHPLMILEVFILNPIIIYWSWIAKTISNFPLSSTQ